MTDPRNRPFIPGYSTTYTSPEGIIGAQDAANARGMVSFDVQYLAKTAFEQSLIGGYAGIPGNHVLAPGSLIDILAGSASYLASGSNPALGSDQLAGMADPNFLNYLEWRDGTGWAVKPGMEATFNEHIAAVKDQLQGFAYSGTIDVGADGVVHYNYVQDTGVVYDPATQSWGPGFFDYETWTAHPMSELSPEAQAIAQNNYYQSIRTQIRGMEANGTVPSSAEFITEASDGRLGSPRFEQFRYSHDGNHVESDFDDVQQYNVFAEGFADEAVDYNTDFLDPTKFAFNVHNFATAVPERLSIGYLNEHPAVLNQVTDLYLTQDVLDRFKANALAAWGENDVRYQSLASRDLAGVRAFIHEQIANGGVDLNNPVYAGFAGLINEIRPHVELLDSEAYHTFKHYIQSHLDMVDRFLASPEAQAMGYTRNDIAAAYRNELVPVPVELAGILGDFIDFSKHAETADIMLRTMQTADAERAGSGLPPATFQMHGLESVFHYLPENDPTRQAILAYAQQGRLMFQAEYVVTPPYDINGRITGNGLSWDQAVFPGDIATKPLIDASIDAGVPVNMLVPPLEFYQGATEDAAYAQFAAYMTQVAQYGLSHTPSVATIPTLNPNDPTIDASTYPLSYFLFGDQIDNGLAASGRDGWYARFWQENDALRQQILNTLPEGSLLRGDMPAAYATSLDQKVQLDAAMDHMGIHLRDRVFLGADGIFAQVADGRVAPTTEAVTAYFQDLANRGFILMDSDAVRLTIQLLPANPSLATEYTGREAAPANAPETTAATLVALDTDAKTAAFNWLATNVNYILSANGLNERVALTADGQLDVTALAAILTHDPIASHSFGQQIVDHLNVIQPGWSVTDGHITAPVQTASYQSDLTVSVFGHDITIPTGTALYDVASNVFQAVPVVAQALNVQTDDIQRA